VEDNKTKQWYVVHAYSGYENFVMREILQRAQLQNVTDKFGEIVVPSEEVVEMRAGQKRKSTRKFFPGYVLVQMIMDDQTWHMVRSIPRVFGFIGGTSQSPTPISEKEANSILQRVEEGATKPRPKILFEPGEVVRVKEGPFVDFNGVVEEVNYEKNKLRVSVLIFGRSTPVELEFNQVEKT
jgi:transcriptional antiterminator NusG